MRRLAFFLRCLALAGQQTCDEWSSFITTMSQDGRVQFVHMDFYDDHPEVLNSVGAFS